jgi:hypothetical protein
MMIAEVVARMPGEYQGSMKGIGFTALILNVETFLNNLRGKR